MRSYKFGMTSHNMYPIKPATNRIPSTSEIDARYLAIGYRTRANPIMTGKCVAIDTDSTAMGCMIEITPTTNNTFNMLLPRILPIDMSDSFFTAHITDAANSGKLVPMATIVSPIITG
jgi:hypothetical protein